MRSATFLQPCRSDSSGCFRITLWNRWALWNPYVWMSEWWPPRTKTFPTWFAPASFATTFTIEFALFICLYRSFGSAEKIFRLLVDHLVSKFNRLQGKDIAGVSLETMTCLMEHDFPGNVRELENIIEQAFVLCRGGHHRTASSAA